MLCIGPLVSASPIWAEQGGLIGFLISLLSSYAYGRHANNIQGLDSVLKGTTYLLTLKRVGVSSILHPMSLAIYLVLPLKWEAYWPTSLSCLTYVDLRVIPFEQKFIVSSGLRLSYLGHHN
ncbi:hypothetical protein E5676_scaffold1369G00120 [Cucumis melo var. makuwa]|uniref:Uncharacterized protein n=1 Tax=Cucumis melo var. makuwa TaxID=1194695 RepID=A0A5D3BX92_CUCMM|nr:hypothetical protein E6C27_scaffold57G001500 [Cucumis melo var. makuwa]TYK03598.1 hypothetical protein E5676_scaffold1369G00120 [Cucumis melo var. makuwa]